MKIKRYIFLLFIITAGSVILAQEATEEPEPIEPVMELLFLKDTDGKINLNASLVNYVNRQPVPLPGLEVVFYAGEESPVTLGRVMTDNDGLATVVLDDIENLPSGPDGIRYFAEYEGTDDIWAAEYEVYIMDVNIDMKLELVDDVKSVTLRAWSIIDGEEVPVADEDIYVYVDRMFMDLPIGEDFLDENGEFTMEMPDDIPGDPEGNIEIIARFNEHYLFGTVENRQVMQWGVPTQYDTVAAQRTLWTQIAPVWMIITLSILLTGVWSHYIYVIISLIRVKRIAKKEKLNDLV
jgi:hypothetical protein